MRICPKCGKNYSEHPAISREDNETEICPNCGLHEAIIARFKSDKVLQRQLFDAIEMELEKRRNKSENTSK